MTDTHSNSGNSDGSDGRLETSLEEAFSIFDRVLDSHRAEPAVREVGRIISVGHGVARVHGLPSVRSYELIRFPHDQLGIAFNLDPDEVGVVLLDDGRGLAADAEAVPTGRVLDVPVGDALLGRVVDPLGRPLDGRGPVRARARLPIERPAPGIMDRSPVRVPLQTGLKVVDALIPVGRGQRQLVLGDRQTGKTALAIDVILNQSPADVTCIYCAVGKRSSSVADVIADLEKHGAMENCAIVVATEEDPPGLQYAAPYAAVTIGEDSMRQGRDVLLVLDDLTRHARAYRELSLLLRRPPGREAYPGDIFYIHSRLLERSTHLREEHGGGSLTAIPIVETEAQNLSAYIPTNLISITDGQIYLSPELFHKGILPAVDVGKSVSRVGGKTQLPAYRDAASRLRLAYSQFEELEGFARFGTRLDEETRQALERGRRVREILRQPQYEPLPVPEQIAVLVAVNGGVFDELSIDEVIDVESLVRRAVREELPELSERIEAGGELTEGDRAALIELARKAASRQVEPREDAAAPSKDKEA